MEKGKTGRKRFAKVSFSWESRLEMQDKHSELRAYSTSVHTTSCGFNASWVGQTSEVAEAGCSFPGLGWGQPKDVAVLDLFPFVVHLVQKDFLNLQVKQRCLPMRGRTTPPLPPHQPELPLHTALAPCSWPRTPKAGFHSDLKMPTLQRRSLLDKQSLSAPYLLGKVS